MAQPHKQALSLAREDVALGVDVLVSRLLWNMYVHRWVSMLLNNQPPY